MGATSAAVPVYAAELAPPKLRGPLGGLFNVFISAGILAVFALGARGTDDGIWRGMAIAAVAPALAVLAEAKRQRAVRDKQRKNRKKKKKLQLLILQ